MPRSSAAYNRSGGGGGSPRTRHKRILGIVLLAGICIGVTYWAIAKRDGASPQIQPALAGTGSSLSASPSSTPTGTASTPPAGLIAADPLGRPASAAPTLTMGSAPASTAMETAATTPPPTPLNPTTQPAATPAPGATPPVQTPPPSALPAGGSPPAGPAPAASDPASASVLAVATGAADRALAQGKPLDARNILNRGLLDPRSTESERATFRKRLAELNQNLLFGPAHTPGDPFSETYRVVGGDNLTKITRKLQLVTEPSAIARVNKMANPGALRVGQTLKVLRGPFHAVVDKSAYRMDLYAGPTPSPTSIGTSGLPDGAEPGWTYICSFPVGLGAQGLTPIANFTLKDGSKLINPHWVNPRTGEKFAADDPKNPIGERWMGLDGLDEKSRAFTGYGIHGTIEPDSIGREMSMGCVRMNAADVEQVYELLAARVSVVKIVP